MTFTLVWLDLLQLVYVVLTYLAIALLADGFRRTHVLDNGAAKVISWAGLGLAALATLGASTGTALSRVPISHSD